MKMNMGRFFQSESTKRWAEYFIKALVLSFVFFVVVQLIPYMPPVCVAIAWAALSIAASIRPMYHFVIKKVYRQHGLKPGRIITRINGGRTLSTVIAFVVSGICIASLMVEAPKWGLADWILAAAAIPLYPLIFLAVGKLIKKSIESPYQLSQTIKASCVAVGLILCLVFLLSCFIGSSASYDTYEQVFDSIVQPFKESPTAILVMVGDYNRIAESLVAYGISKVSLASVGLGFVLRAVIRFTSFFAISRLLAGCILKPHEIKLAFMPLDAAMNNSSDYPLVKFYVALSCLLPTLLAAGFLFAESQVEKIVNTEEYKDAMMFVLDQAKVTASVIDGQSVVDGQHFISKNNLKKLVAVTSEEVIRLAEKRDEELVPLVNAMYDKRLENIDAYLDWYYSPFGEADRIAHFIARSEAQEQFYAIIEKGVDDADFIGRCRYYADELDEIVKEFKVKVAQLSIPEDSARKLINDDMQRVSSEDLVKSLDPNQSFLEESDRLSAGVGFGPETGRFIGFFDGFVFLPVDQLINREAFKETIVAIIEEDREKMIEKVKASDESTQNYLSELMVD